MIFKKVLEAVELIKVKRSDSDYIDRLNHRWTCILLVIACLLLTTANYGSLPMFCWCPAYFVSAYEKYAQKICWVSESYNIVDDRSQNFPASNRGSEDARDGGYYYSTRPHQSISSEGKKVLRVSYYQWIPLLLLLQSFFFYLPGLMWKTLAARSGLDLANIVEASDTVQNAIYPERREKTLRYMSRHINRFLTFQNNYRGGCCRCFRGVFRWRWCFCCGNKFGNYMSSLYLGLKLVNLANIVLQVLFIDFYLGSHFHLLGLAFIHGLSTNQTTAMVTAIASNHPLIAHQGNNAYSPQNSGSMVKRDLGRVDLHPVATKEGFFTASGIDITTINKSGHENPEILLIHSATTKSNETESTIYRNDHSSNEDVSNSENNLPIVDANRVNKLTNRSRRDDRRANDRHVNSQRHRKHISGSYDWSTYMASLTSFPYLSSKLFPKITYCDFTVHQMTTIQLFTTQCVLSINFINEKLFLLLWFWFCLLFLINMYSIFIWSITLCIKSSRENYIRRQLAMIQRRIFLDSAQYNRQSPPQPSAQYPSSSYRPSVVESTLAERKLDLPPNADDGEDKATELEPLRPSPASRRLVKFDETLTMQDHQELSYEQAIKSFVHCRLKQDGVFILKILATNTTRLVELDVLALLWSVHERRLATTDPYYTSDRRESLIQPSSERRDTIVDVTELRRAKAAMSEREL